LGVNLDSLTHLNITNAAVCILVEECSTIGKFSINYFDSMTIKSGLGLASQCRWMLELLVFELIDCNGFGLTWNQQRGFGMHMCSSLGHPHVWWMTY